MLADALNAAGRMLSAPRSWLRLYRLHDRGNPAAVRQRRPLARQGSRAGDPAATGSAARSLARRGPRASYAMPAGNRACRTPDPVGSPGRVCRILGSGDERAARSYLTAFVMLLKQPTDSFAANRARDQSAQQRQRAFQPTATPARRVGGSFDPKSPAIAMQRNDEIGVADIGQSDLGEAEPIMPSRCGTPS
jgi:hypothetical protein